MTLILNKNYTDQLGAKEQEDLYKPGTVKAALTYLERETVSDRKGKQFGLCCELDEFKKYGQGPYFYFLFLKQMIGVLVVISLISFAPMYLYVFGAGLGDSAQNNILLYSSLGNLQSKNLEFSTQLVAQRDTQFESKRVEQYLSYFRIVVWSDFVYSLLLICFFLWWRKYKDSISNHVENVVNSPAKFALEISNIPSDTTEEELKEFLSRRYPQDFINQINFAFRFNNTLSYFMKLSDLEIQKKIVRTNNENQATNQLRSKLIQLDRNIAQTEANLRSLMPHLQESKGANGLDQKLDLNGLEKLKAFVIFEKSSSARSVKIDYDRRVHNLGWFGTLDQKFLFRGNQKLDLAFPDYPDNIKWENLEIGGCNKIMRVLATTTATILVMVVCFIAILFLNIGSSVAESVKLDCPDRVNTINEISILPKDAPNYALMSQCFCKSQSVFTIIRNDQVNEICSSYLRSSILTNLLSIAGGLAIAVTNFGLKQLLRWFTKFEKFKDLTSECSSLVTFGLIAAYVNTVVVTILSSAEFPNGYIPSQVIASMAGFNANDIPTYTDFSRDWYKVTGLKISLAIFFSTFSPHLIQLLIMPIIRCFRMSRVSKAKLQKEMNDIIKPDVFDLAYQYVGILNMLFVSLTFSGLMPFLLILNLAGFILIYICDKIAFSESLVPPQYNTTLTSTVTQILPFSVLLHLAFSIWAYGVEEIFPINGNIRLVNVATDVFSANSAFSNGLIKRAYNAAPLTLLFIYLAYLLLSEHVIVRFFKFIFCYSSKAERDRRKVEQEESLRGKTYSKSLQAIMEVSSPNYDMRHNEKYQQILLLFQKYRR